MKIFLVILVLGLSISCDEERSSMRKSTTDENMLDKERLSDTLADSNVSSNTVCLIKTPGGGCENFDTSQGGCDPYPDIWRVQSCPGDCTDDRKCRVLSLKQKLDTMSCENRNLLLDQLKADKSILYSREFIQSICFYGTVYGSQGQSSLCHYENKEKKCSS